MSSTADSDIPAPVMWHPSHSTLAEVEATIPSGWTVEAMPVTGFFEYVYKTEDHPNADNTPTLRKRPSNSTAEEVQFSLPRNWSFETKPDADVYEYTLRTNLHPSVGVVPAVSAPFEKRVDEDGKTYYVNHDTKTTSWTHPDMTYPPPVEPPFEMRMNEKGYFYYVNHDTEAVSWLNPVHEKIWIARGQPEDEAMVGYRTYAGKEYWVNYKDGKTF